MRQFLNKLVRDKVPEIIRKSGRCAATRVLDDHEYLMALQAKLDEEAKEFRQTKSLEELADILEVLRAITSSLGTDLNELERLRIKKHFERGGFEQRVLLMYTDTESEHFSSCHI